MNWNKSGDFKIVRPITGAFKLEASKYVLLKFVELLPFLVYSVASGLLQLSSIYLLGRLQAGNS